MLLENLQGSRHFHTLLVGMQEYQGNLAISSKITYAFNLGHYNHLSINCISKIYRQKYEMMYVQGDSLWYYS